MALVDLKSNLANYRSTFTTPSVETQAVPALSKPSNVNKTQFTKSFVDKSKFDRPDDFILKYTGRTQFRQNFINKSKFNLDSTPSKFGNDVNQSNFKDISGTNFNYPNLKGLGTRLMQPANTINSNTISKFPGPQNFLNDDFASGFTNDFWNTRKGLSKKETQFRNLNYIDTVSISTPLNSSKGPGGGWNLGDTSFTSQLGNGSTNLIKSYDTLITNTYNWYTPTGDNGKKGKESKHTGFHANNKYLSKGTSFKGFLAATYNTNSPVDDVYKKFNLQDEAYNPTYIKQPFIVRGIQRKGNETPQYWGFGSKSGFDDGLIRGGVVTVADRVVADTIRIAKFMASPKGLLWIVKQIGLGLTNPKVEAIGGTFGRQTRIHTGVTSLLSVVGTPFGLHFTRHGIPFANEVASYENVQTTKKGLYSEKLPEPSNRLLGLRNELGLNTNTGASLIQKGQPILSLSGLGGPQSVYGIGSTTIRRGAKSIEGGPAAILVRREINPFSNTINYAGKKAGYQTAIATGINGYERVGNYFRPDLKTISTNLFPKNFIKGPGTSAKDYSANPYNPNIVDKESKGLADRKAYSNKQYAGTLRANTQHDFDPNKDTNKNTSTNVNEFTSADPETKDSLKTRLSKVKTTPGADGLSSKETKELADRKRYSDKQYAGTLRANTQHDFDANKDTTHNTVDKVDELDNGLKTTKLDIISTPIGADGLSSKETKDLADRKQYSDAQYAGTLRANTQHDFDANKDTTTNTVAMVDKLATGLNTRLSKVETTPGANEGNSIETNAGKVSAYPTSPNNPINDYITLAYNKIPKLNGISINDFRNDINNAGNLTDIQKGIVGVKKDDVTYYETNNLETKYGFGKLGQVGADRSDPNKFLVPAKDFVDSTDENGKVTKKNRFVLVDTEGFRGDKVTAIDIASPGKDKPVYTENGQDLITFYFEDGVEGTNVMPFRCTMTGFTDSFNPGWDRIDIMGRPDGAYLYTSFDRQVSFNFTVAALSRSEMIPMWRKLNYLSTYTMPDFIGSARPSGPFMRISIGDLFKNTPGFISSLSYTIPDETTWDIAEDAKVTVNANVNAKQLPMAMEVAMSFTIVGDFRPELMGRAYSLQGNKRRSPSDWLADSSIK